MKNCSCIFARQRDGEEVMLFEGYHPIPFFWLMLLDKEDVEIYRKLITQLSQEDARHQDTSMCLDKLKAISRAGDRRDYVQQFTVTCLPLFDDWLYFLQIADFADMKIYMDLYQISSSYSTLNVFCDSLLKAIDCFDNRIEAWSEVSVPATCGYEGRNRNKKRFSEISKAYRELNQQDIYGRFDKRLHLHKNMPYKKKKWFFVIFLLALALLIGSFLCLFAK